MNEKEVKWHAEKLHDLLMPEVENSFGSSGLAQLCVDLQAKIIDNARFKGVKSTPPEM